MRRITGYVLTAVLIFCALNCFASCVDRENTAANDTPVPVSETALPAENTPAPSEQAPKEPSPEPTAEPTPDPNARPDPVTVEWLATELMRRYYTGIYLTHELEDYSDIMERNEETDLFCYDNMLEIEKEKLYGCLNVLEVTRWFADIQKVISESDTEITVDVWVATNVVDDDPNSEDSVGIDFQITVDKQRMVIIAYDRPYMCEGYYRNELKPLALRYRNQGMSWQDADKKAYDELHARIVAEGY